jgi:hypothetical protein
MEEKIPGILVAKRFFNLIADLAIFWLNFNMESGEKFQI